MLLARFLHKLIHVGTLTVIDAKGQNHCFQGEAPGPSVTIRLHDKALHRLLATNPDLHLGEAYMYGTLTVEGGADLYDFMDLIGRNYEAGGLERIRGMTSWSERLLRRLRQFNPAGWSRANVAHHYDLSGQLYDLFLDPDRQYSCAYFPTGNETLEQAQLAKKRHITHKLLLEPGMRVLDIGCGWGGMGLHLAGEHGARVTGITLSTEQHRLANRRAQEAGLADQAEFVLRDYRHQDGRFDRIVSVGMFEHVGLNHYHEFFAKLRDLLADDGVALLHTIGRMEGPGATNAWIRRHIFPGGYIPALSEITRAVEDVGLWVTDVEVLRLHYAETLRHWRQRFLANRERAKALYDEAFCRMWEFYLVGSEVSFRYLGNMVFQVQLARRQDAVPLTRDYITEADRRAPALPSHAAE